MLSITDSSKSKKTFLEVALSAAKKAGKFVLLESKKNVRVSYKDQKEVVTQVDRDSEELIISEIKKQYPDHSFWSEERPEEKTSSPFRWIIDPIDGTLMFVRGIPTFGISIGLEKNGEGILGVCFFPALNLMYHAEKGKGAYCNNSKIEVSKTKETEQRIYLSTTGLFRTEAFLDFEEEVKERNLYIKDFGSAALALCFLAHGKCDASLIYTIKPCDISAGMVIVKEAGGKVSTPSGSKATSFEKTIIASNSILHSSIMKSLK